MPDEHEPRKGRLPSHAGRGALWLTGTVIAALIAALLGAYFSGGLSNFTAQKTQSDDVKRVVDDFLAAVKRGQPDAADRLTGGAKSRQWKAWDPAADPVVWMSRVAIDPDVKTADSARAYAKPSVWGFRRAEAGCRELGEAFHLVSRDGRWLIDELPGLGGRCGERLMAASWTSYRPEGVQRWERKDLQRVDVVRARQSTAVVGQDADKTVDQGRSARPSPKVSTAFMTHRQDWQGASLSFVFERPVTLVRMRFHNGVRSGYFHHGRIRRALVTAGDRRVEVQFPDRNARFRLDCDFGKVREIALRITDIYPARTPPVNNAQVVPPIRWASVDAASSDVALSDVDFWARVGDAGVSEPRGPYAFATHPDQPRDQEVVATCGQDAIPPVAAPSPVTPPAASTPAPQPAGAPATQPAPPPAGSTAPAPQAPPETSPAGSTTP